MKESKEDTLLVEMANGNTVESLELEMLSGRTADSYEQESLIEVKPFNKQDLVWSKLFHILKRLLDGASMEKGK